MRAQLLGPVVVHGDDGRLLAVGGPKQRTVLALLCIDPGRPVSSDHLIEGVWGDEIPVRAARSLSTYVSNLRRILGDAIDGERGTYRFTSDRSCVDAAVFEDLVHLADTAASDDPSGTARMYREATSMWVDAPFGGVDAHGLLTAEITRLEDLHLLATERALSLEVDGGLHREAVVELELLVAQYPYHENLRHLHMRALYLCGRQTDALASYRTHREHLASGLGLDPSPRLQALELQILNHDESLIAMEASSTTPPEVARLPLRYSRFVGREDEINVTLARLKDHRLVTVVGPGGIGKSSVVLEAVRTLSPRSDVMIAYAAMERVGDVAAEVARSMGLAPGPDVDPLEVVVGYLQTHPKLLVLDGCEAQLRDVAVLVDRVLSSTESTVLVTSREPLGLNGESTIRIDGLPIGDAVTVFCDRAQLTEPVHGTTLETVRSVCSELDGLPLAIELLAARARSVPLDRLASRLGAQIPLLSRARSFDERHGSLLAALDWSYNLLSEAEQRMLRAVSVFVAPFTIQDAVTVVGDPDIEDDIDRLVEVSLLQPPTSNGRYRFLEPIRQFATYRLVDSGEREEYECRHAEWIASAAERIVLDATGFLPREISRWIFDERDEMLAAVDWALEHDDPDVAVRIVAAVGRGIVAVGLHGPWVSRGLVCLEHPRSTRNGVWAIAAARVAFMLALEDRRDAGVKLLEQAQEVAESAGDRTAAWTMKQRRLVLEGWLENTESQLEMMKELDQTLPVGRELEVGGYRYNEAVILLFLGRFDEAEAIIRKQRERWEELASTSPWTYYAVMSGIEAFKGELESSLQTAMKAVAVAEHERIYGPACGLLQRVGALADRTGNTEMLVEAIERHRHIETITGAPPSVLLEMRFAQATGRHERVLELAGSWFREYAGDPLIDDVSFRASEETMLLGGATEMPRILAILRPVAFALHGLGRTGEACLLALAVPALMAESRFVYWDQFRERLLWEPLSELCRGAEPEPMTLSEACEAVRAMVHAPSGTALV